MTLLSDSWPVSKNGISFKLYASSFDTSSFNHTPDLAFDGDFGSHFHTGLYRQLEIILSPIQHFETAKQVAFTKSFLIIQYQWMH